MKANKLDGKEAQLKVKEKKNQWCIWMRNENEKKAGEKHNENGVKQILWVQLVKPGGVKEDKRRERMSLGERRRKGEGAVDE